MCLADFRYANGLYSLLLSNSHSLERMEIKMTCKEAYGGSSPLGLMRILVRGPNWHNSVILNSIFAEAVILWTRCPRLSGRYQDTISICLAPWQLFLIWAPVFRPPLIFHHLHCSLRDLSGTETARSEPCSRPYGVSLPAEIMCKYKLVPVFLASFSNIKSPSVIHFQDKVERKACATIKCINSRHHQRADSTSRRLPSST